MRQRFLAAVILATMVVAAGCGPGSKTGGQPDPVSTIETPRKGGTLMVAQGVEPPALDPQFDSGQPAAAVEANLYEGLVTLDSSMKVVSALAETWEISPDGQDYTFHLRNGVKFHDGTPFNAEAVKFTLERAQGKNGAKPSRYVSLLTALESVTVVNDTTVKMHLKTRYVPWLRTLAHLGVSMISPAAVQKYGDQFVRNPVGTGPFKFVSWKSGSELILERNPDYWNKDVPMLDQVTYRFIPDEETRQTALEKGEVEVNINPPLTALAAIKENKSLKVVDTAGMTTVFYMLNPAMEPFTDIKVRQAVFAAINAAEINQSALQGAMGVAEHPTWPAVVYGADPKLEPYKFDPAAANKLLDEAGWMMGSNGIRTKDNKPLSFDFSLPTGQYPGNTLLGETLQLYLKKVGIQMNVKTTDWNTHRNLMIQKKVPGMIFSAGVSTGDLDYVLTALFHSSSGYHQVKVPTLDSLIDQGRAEMNESKRLDTYSQVQQQVRDMYFFYPIYYEKIIWAMSSKVYDLTADPRGNLLLGKVWK